MNSEKTIDLMECLRLDLKSLQGLRGKNLRTEELRYKSPMRRMHYEECSDSI